MSRISVSREHRAVNYGTHIGNKIRTTLLGFHFESYHEISNKTYLRDMR